MQSGVSLGSLGVVEERMLRRLALESKVSLDSISDNLKEAGRLVRLGHARFVAVAYPWGVEFELEITPSGHRFVQERRSGSAGLSGRFED